MRKIVPILLALLLGLSACGTASPQPSSQQAEDSGVVVVATTYPVYLFATAVTAGVPGYEVRLMIDQPVSCLHDYTLSVSDMRTLEAADVVVMNGAGLEETLADALDSIDGVPVIDCSAGIELLPGENPGEGDPHIWMDPSLAGTMTETIAEELSAQDPDNAEGFSANAQAAREQLTAAYHEMKEELAGLSCRELITFHDGFSYFARAFDLTILRSIEEEAGSEASAKDVGDILAEIESHDLPALFTEVNGATATAEMISRESGVAVASLDLIMSRDHGDRTGIDAYLARMANNISTIREVYP